MLLCGSQRGASVQRSSDRKQLAIPCRHLLKRAQSARARATASASGRKEVVFTLNSLIDLVDVEALSCWHVARSLWPDISTPPHSGTAKDQGPLAVFHQHEHENNWEWPAAEPAKRPLANACSLC